MRIRPRRLIGLFVVCLATTAHSQMGPFSPPVAQRIPKADTLHGDIRIDDYHWLRERSNPEVRKYLEAENAYTDSMMKPTQALQESLFSEMRRRIKETDFDVPYREGNFFYYSRTEKDKQYPIYCRKASLDREEEVTLDQNVLAKDFRFLRLGDYMASPDGRILAYSLDTNGSEHYTMFFKNLGEKSLLPDRLVKVVDAAWANDNATVFYTTLDSAERPYRLYRHRLGTLQSEDPLILEEKDGLFELSVSRSKSGSFIFINSRAKTSCEVQVIPADHPENPPAMISPREANHEYFADHNGDFFYIRTNKGTKNFRLVSAPVSAPGQENWHEIIPGRQDVTLEGVEIFAKFFVALERRNGLQEMRVMSFQSRSQRPIEFPEPVYTASSNVNRDFNSPFFRFAYQSFTTPPSIYDLDLSAGTRVLRKQTEVLGGYDPTAYSSERLYAPASDGTPIPVSLVYKKGVKIDGSAPLHLYGYGSYGSSSNVTFSSNRLSLLNRGFIYAVAHIRGGGDLGRSWKEDGRMLKKKNTFSDFVACAEFLLKKHYTSPGKLTIEGGSAGGLLMGAVTNLRPDLFKAVIAQVPFVDVLNTMLDPGLMYTVQEYQEWGNPHEKVYYDYIKSYCPYTNVTRQAYPRILAKVGFNDPRVNYWEGTKWVAKLRANTTSANPIMLKVNWGAGHMGSSGRFDFLREIAFNYAWLISQMQPAN